jgi:hypothetical protein
MSSKETFPVMELYSVTDSMSNTIESLAIWGKDRLIVGTTEGVLIIFNVEYIPKDKKKFKIEMNSIETKKGFATKNITKLCVIEELKILVSICDGTVKIHLLGILKFFYF